MVNTAEGPEPFISALGKERVVLSFSATGGELTEHGVECLLSDTYEIPLGSVNEHSHLDEIICAFNQADIGVNIYGDMDSWLKYHDPWFLPWPMLLSWPMGPPNSQKILP
ncbi:MAG: hypothetical protein HXS47_12385 [Theionarchaea archaeon]|nr:hypothetical protein [Theionarchaea archaeon]